MYILALVNSSDCTLHIGAVFNNPQLGTSLQYPGDQELKQTNASLNARHVTANGQANEHYFVRSLLQKAPGQLKRKKNDTVSDMLPSTDFSSEYCKQSKNMDGKKKKKKDLLNLTSVCSLRKQQPTTPVSTSTSCRTENKCTGRFKIQHARHDVARAVLINHY